MSENERPHTTTNSEQQSESLSRRGLFQVLGAAPAAALAARPMLAQVNPHHAHLPVPLAAQAANTGPYERKVFTDQQFRTVRILADLIIPADERSGSASDAGVPEFIDDWLNFRSEQDDDQDFQAQILGGLMWLDRESDRLFEKPFADAAVDQQKQLLDRVAWPERAAKEDAAGVMFFNHFRDLTVGGFFIAKWAYTISLTSGIPRLRNGRDVTRRHGRSLKTA